MFDLDRLTLDLDCPNCGFMTPAFYRQARLRAPLICRGCHCTIQLDDHMNECRKAREAVARAMAELEATIAGFNKTFTIRF